LTGSWAKGRTAYYPYYRFLASKMLFKKENMENNYKVYLNKFGMPEEHYKLLKQKLQKHFSKGLANEQKNTETFKKLIADLEEKQRYIIDQNQKGVYPDEVAKDQITTIRKELFDTKEALNGLTPVNTNLEELFGYVEKYLQTPSEIWHSMSFRKKLDLQWFQFPQGVTFDGTEFETTQLRSIFKAKDLLLSESVHVVNHLHQITNPKYGIAESTAEINNNFDEKAFWYEVVKDMEDLANILRVPE